MKGVGSREWGKGRRSEFFLLPYSLLSTPYSLFLKIKEVNLSVTVTKAVAVIVDAATRAAPRYVLTSGYARKRCG
jgi:hypothetical protein